MNTKRNKIKKGDIMIYEEIHGCLRDRERMLYRMLFL